MALLMASCSQNQTAGKDAAADTVKSCCAQALTPAQILAGGESFADSTVTVAGKATHVCHCSGKKFVLVDEQDSTQSIRVLAGGEVDTFSQALVGQHVKLTGVVKVTKTTKEDIEKKIAAIDSMAAAKAAEAKDKKTDAKAEKKEGCGHGEKKEGGHCGGNKADMFKAKAAEMLKWMEDNQKDYYPGYYIEIVKFADCCKDKNAPADTTAVPDCCKK